MLVRTYRDQQAAKAAAAHRHGHGAHDETKVIDTGHGLALLSVFEQGVPPRLRVHFTDRGGRPVPPPAGDAVTVETLRDDGARQTFTFAPRGDFLEATAELPEPHQFAATVSIGHHDHAHRYETRFVEHDHGHTHGHEQLDPEDAGYQDAHERAHALEIRERFANRNVTTGQIALFGLTGGLLPCPAAVTVLLLCLQLQKFWLGIILVLCFSIGLALTLLASGVVAAWGVRHVSRRWSGFDTLARRLPYFASTIIICVGLYVGYQGWASLT